MSGMRRTVIMVIAIALIGQFTCPVDVRGGDAASLVLAEVNGEPITGADLDQFILEAHSADQFAGMEQGLVPRLLERAIRETLMLQDARAIGMFEEDRLSEPVLEDCRGQAMAAFARSTVTVPEVPEAEVQAYFDRFYNKIQVRQITLATEAECRDLRARINEQVTMGRLAVDHSLDRFRERGGLRGDVFWRDLDPVLREASRGVEVGGYSEPFQVGEHWAFIRVESRTDPSPEDLVRFRSGIQQGIKQKMYEEAWASLVAEHERAVPVTIDQELLAAIKRDEQNLYRGEFKRGTDAPVMRIDDAHFVTETRFRKQMSREAMSMGQSSFDEILEHTLELLRERLVMGFVAAREGFLDDPEVVEYCEQEITRVVLEAYLAEFIAAKVRLNRDEYEKFYREHQDDFRGPDEVILSFLTLPDEATARSAHERLLDGADFDYVKQQIEGKSAGESPEEGQWTEVRVFSDQIKSQLEAMRPGEVSRPIPVGSNWMIFRLDGRRDGDVLPIEAVDGSIRQVLYMREFGRLLEEHVDRLREASEVVRYDDRILQWADSGS